MERRRRFPPFGACDYWGDRRIKRIKKEEEEYEIRYELRTLYFGWEGEYAPAGIPYHTFTHGDGYMQIRSVTAWNRALELVAITRISVMALIWDVTPLNMTTRGGFSINIALDYTDNIIDDIAYVQFEFEVSGSRLYRYYVVRRHDANRGTTSEIWDVINGNKICTYSMPTGSCTAPPGHTVIDKGTVLFRRVFTSVSDTFTFDGKVKKIAFVAVGSNTAAWFDDLSMTYLEEIRIKK